MCVKELHKLPTSATEADIRAVVAREYPWLESEAFMRGIREIIADERRALVKLVPQETYKERSARRERERAEMTKAVHSVVREIKIGAVVDYLDKHMVGGKPLGACTGADLDREIGNLERGASARIAEAGFLSAIREHVGHNERVDAADRSTILRILGEHFADD